MSVVLAVSVVIMNCCYLFTVLFMSLQGVCKGEDIQSYMIKLSCYISIISVVYIRRGIRKDEHE